MYLLIFLILFFCVSGILIYKKAFNTMTVFNGVWFIAIGLYNLKLTQYQSDLSDRGIYALILMILGFNLMYFYTKGLYIILPRKKNEKKCNITITKVLSEKNIKLLFLIWLSMIVFEVIYSRGLPLLWILTGTPKSYAMFGIPTVHGLVNSLAWVILMIAFCYYLDSEKNKSTMRLIIFSIIAVYMLLLARQFIITGIFQLVMIYSMKRELKLRQVLFGVATFIVIFGMVGNFRSGADHFRIVSGIDTNTPDFLMGIYWIYMYMVTPIGNIDSLVNQSFDYGNGLFSMVRLIPTALVSWVSSEIQLTNPEFLVTKAFNVSTFLQIPYQDFGMVGILLVSTIHGAIGACLWNNYKLNKNSNEAIMLFAIYLQIITMSFFTNMSLNLPIIIQFLYITLFFKFNVITQKHKVNTLEKFSIDKESIKGI